jgi:hypothetical protein
MTRSAAHRGLLWLAAITLLAGCAGAAAPGPTAPVPAAPPAAGWSPVPIADIKSVAGKWEGQLTRARGPRDDWMELTIREDGSYEAVSYRTIGVLRGTGRLTLTDGKLVAQGERGTATLALSARGAERRLDVTMRNREGADITSTFAPAR